MWRARALLTIRARRHRAQCFTEQCWSMLTKPSYLSWDLGKLDETLLDEAFGLDEEQAFNAIMNTCTTRSRRPPLLPEQFAEAIGTKKFTNGKEDAPLVVKLYSDTFAEQFAAADVLAYVDVDWTDADLVQLVAVLRDARGAMPHVDRLYLHGNHRISDAGLEALAAALAEDREVPEGCHPGVTCDGCNTTPLRGVRFKYDADLDLCKACYECGTAAQAAYTRIEPPSYKQPLVLPNLRWLVVDNANKHARLRDVCERRKIELSDHPPRF